MTRPHPLIYADIYAELPPAGEVRCAQPKSGCTPGAGLARTVAARKARALSGLMASPAPPTTPPAVPNGLPVRPRNNFLRTVLVRRRLSRGLHERVEYCNSQGPKIVKPGKTESTCRPSSPNPGRQPSWRLLVRCSG